MNPCHCYFPRHLPQVDSLAPTRAGGSFILNDPSIEGPEKVYRAAICTREGSCTSKSLTSNLMYNFDDHTHIIVTPGNPGFLPMNAPNIVKGESPIPHSYCYFVTEKSGEAPVQTTYAFPPPKTIPCSSHYHLINEGPGRGAWSEITFP